MHTDTSTVNKSPSEGEIGEKHQDKCK